MSADPTFSARATPLGRAAAAIETRIRQSIAVELRPGMIGQPFAATMPELARDAVSAALYVEEIADVLNAHRPDYPRSGRAGCSCGTWRFEPQWEGTRSSERRTAARKAFATHQAAALRAATLKETHHG